jgi:hypothetical protein
MGHDKYIVALGLVSTCKPDMVIDIDDPVGMMTKVCEEFDQLRARNAELEAELFEARQAIFREGISTEEYKADVARMRKALERLANP